MKRLLATALLLTAAICLPVYPKCGVPTTKRHRSTVVKFEKLTGYPHGRPGYVADHIVPLCAAGADVWTNLRWNEAKEAKKRDVEELALCRAIKKNCDPAPNLCLTSRTLQLHRLEKDLCELDPKPVPLKAK